MRGRYPRDPWPENPLDPGQGQTEWEEHLIGAIRQKPIGEREMSALILARRGQGLFKQRVRQVERRCRITGVDRGFISFETDGRLLVSPVAHRKSLERMGVPLGERVNVGAFSEGQRRYLEFHQERVFLEAKVERASFRE